MDASPFDPEGPLNPYAPPTAPIGEEAPAVSDELAVVEATRRRYLTHETNVKSIGSLHYLGAFFSVIAVIAMLAALSSNPTGSGTSESLFGLALQVVQLALNVALGIGLSRLRPWARWVESALNGLSLLMLVGLSVVIVGFSGGSPAGLLFLFVAAIPGYILYLMLSAKGAVVFSPEYREVIARTPHIKYKSSCIVKFFLLFLLAVFVIAIAAALVGIKR